jgi:DNA-binding MarR family transcriptional regulator
MHAETLAGFERSLAAVMRLLTDRATLHDISRRSGHELPPTSWALLEHLDRRGALRVSDIAACHGIDVSSVTPRLKALEQSGLVVRESLPADARVSIMRITPFGRQALESVHAVRRDIIEQALAGTGASRIATAAGVLDTIASALTTAEGGRA